MPASAVSIGPAAGALAARGLARRVLRFTLRLRFAIRPPYQTFTMPRRAGSIEPGQPADIGRRQASRAQFAQARGGSRFGELLAVGIEEQAVVVVPWRGQAEQCLKQTVHAGGV